MGILFLYIIIIQVLSYIVFSKQDFNIILFYDFVEDPQRRLPKQSNSFRLAMNQDGSMSVVSDIPIVTSHYIIDESERKVRFSKEEDCVSIASDMSDTELQPSRLSARRSVILMFAWICMVSNTIYAVWC